MNILQAFFSALALCMSGAAWAGPIPDTQESGMGLSTFDLPAALTGAVEVTFDATPLADKIDGFTGISEAGPRKGRDVAAMVRFSDKGTMDVPDGNSFRADQTLRYSANKVYRVRMVIDVASRKYSVFVTPPGQAEVLLASKYDFRNHRTAALSKFVVARYNGMHRVSGVLLKAVSSQ